MDQQQETRSLPRTQPRKPARTHRQLRPSPTFRTPNSPSRLPTNCRNPPSLPIPVQSSRYHCRPRGAAQFRYRLNAHEVLPLPSFPSSPSQPAGTTLPSSPSSRFPRRHRMSRVDDQRTTHPTRKTLVSSLPIRVSPPLDPSLRPNKMVDCGGKRTQRRRR